MPTRARGSCRFTASVLSAKSKTGEEAELVRKIDRIERELRLAGIKAERDTLFQLARARILPDEMARSLVRDLDLLETRYAAT